MLEAHPPGGPAMGSRSRGRVLIQLQRPPNQVLRRGSAEKRQAEACAPFHCSACATLIASC